jgi:hypothetical protein
MSHLLRCGLVAAGLVLAFAAGFYLKPVPTVPTVAAQPAPAPVVAPPITDLNVNPATALGQPPPARPEPDPLDAAGMAMIRRELGHKTTVLDKSEPLPAVLADAQKTPPVELPIPMGGPMPRLEPPPVLAVPMIDHAPIRRPDLPTGTLIRITIRDPSGNPTTVTTSGQVTIDLVAPDGPRPGPDRGPMPREIGTSAIPEPLRSLLPILLGSPSLLVPITWVHPSSEPARLKWSIETARGFVDTPVVEVEPVNRFVRRDPFGPPVCGELYPRAIELFVFLRTEELEDNEGTGVWYVANGIPYTPEEHERVKYMGSGPPEVIQAFFHPSVVHYRRREETRLRQRQLRLGEDVSNICSGGRSLIQHLADLDWKPTTATPKSCRWEYEPAPTSFWGTPPLGLRFEF